MTPATSSHALLPPSSAHIWGAPGGCPGWPSMAPAFPTIEGDEAREGTAAHELANLMITGRELPAIAGNGVEITDEIRESAATFARDVMDHEAFGPSWELYTERRVACHQIHPMHVWGTCDAFGIHRDAMRIVVWDYKHGHREVNARNNWQLFAYVLGVLSWLGWSPDAVGVQFRIVQPRAYRRMGPVDVWEVTPGAISGAAAALHEAAMHALGPNARTHSGAHCRDCTARHACPAALQAGAALYEATAEALPIDVTPDQLAARYELTTRAVKHLTSLQKAYDAQLTALIESGRPVGLYTLMPGVGNESWDIPDEVAIATAAAFGVEIGRTKPLTPNQARAAGVPAATIAALASRKQTALKLVKIDQTKAMEVFKS
jgi:hypothetical protein